VCSDCTNTVCLNLYFSPCDSGINTGIVLDTSGDYTVLVTFNGIVKRADIEVVANEPIILENILIAPYTHEIKIYDVDGNLVNGTCYMANTYLTLTASGLTPNPPSCAKKFITVESDGATITDEFIGIHTISSIGASNQLYLGDGVDFTQSGDTITMTNGVTFYAGQIVLATA